MSARAGRQRAGAAPVQDKARRRARLATRQVFYRRMVRSGTLSFALVGGTLLVGVIGYRALSPLGWLDAFHQSALLLSGMGPLDEAGWSSAAKLFDSLYALFCGMVLLVSSGLLFAPILHRIIHKFHLQDARDDD
jgi:hypothetical protein